ncbi:MAG: hypothetical protein WDW36_008322 [Sanguina aurantia]
MQGAVDTIRSSPSIIFIPALLFLVLAAVGLWAVTWSSNNKNAEIFKEAVAVAQSTVLSLELSLYVTLQPSLVMASFVRQFPNWNDLSPRFPSFAEELYDQASFEMSANSMISSVRLLPFGVIKSTAPPTDPYFATDRGVDTFLSPARLPNALTIIRQNTTTLSWTVTSAVSKVIIRTPVFIVVCSGLGPRAGHGVIIRTPVFIGNVSQAELFGQADDRAMQAACAAICYRPDVGAKFWGFTAVVMNVDPIMQGTHSSLVNLTALGYVYRIYRPANLSSATPDIFIAGNAGGDYALGDMYMEVIEVPNSQWFIFMAPAKGWTVPWTAGLLAGTVLLAALAACFLAYVMISRRQHELLLLSLVPLSVVERVRRENPYKLYRQDTDTVTSSGTPADRILDMMSQLLRGVSPSLQDVILVRTAMMQSFDLYAPIGVEQNIRDAVHDIDVGAALVALVGAARTPRSAPDVAKRFEAPAQLTWSEAQCDRVFGEGAAGATHDTGPDDLRSVLHDIMHMGSRCSGELLPGPANSPGGGACRVTSLPVGGGRAAGVTQASHTHTLSLSLSAATATGPGPVAEWGLT